MTITRHSRSFLLAVVQCCCFLGARVSAQTSNQSNYNNCFYGYSSCDKSRLSQSELEQVAAAAHQRNYNDCLYGYVSCDKSRLSQSELEQVAAAAHQRNYNDCLYGYVSCDKSRLSQSELEQVAAAAHQRNYNDCLYGYVSCDKSRLSQSELEQVAAAAHQRNYNDCLYGYVSCDKSRLSQSELEQVAAAAHQRNYNDCLYGYVSCDKSKLDSGVESVINSSGSEPRAEFQTAPEVQRLGYFVGTWNIVGQILSRSFGVMGKFTGQYRNHWSTDGLSLISDWNELRPAITESGQSTYEYDPELKSYVCQSVDSSGEKESSVGHVDGQTWTWLSSHTTADGNLGGRFSIKEESAGKYTFKFESQSSTGEWELAIEGSASKKP